VFSLLKGKGMLEDQLDVGRYIAIAIYCSNLLCLQKSNSLETDNLKKRTTTSIATSVLPPIQEETRNYSDRGTKADGRIQLLNSL
jgi:hypothetical protein